MTKEDALRAALNEWKEATGNLPWGVQSLCHDTLLLAANEHVSLVHSTDVFEGTPCLFNAISNMSQQLGQSPAQYAREVVGAFDRVNSLLNDAGVNKMPHKVSPLSAEILYHHFGQLKTRSEEDEARYATELASFAANCTPYIEPTDEEVMAEWLLTIANGNTHEGAQRSTSV